MRHAGTHYRAQSFHMLKASFALEMFRPNICDIARSFDFFGWSSLPRASRDTHCCSMALACACVSLCLHLDGMPFLWRSKNDSTASLSSSYPDLSQEHTNRQSARGVRCCTELSFKRALISSQRELWSSSRSHAKPCFSIQLLVGFRLDKHPAHLLSAKASIPRGGSLRGSVQTRRERLTKYLAIHFRACHAENVAKIH